MNRTIEVELKYEIFDIEKVEAFVKKLPYKESKHIIDVYLDTKDGKLFQKGIFIRIRNGNKFDIKFNKEDLSKSLDDQIEHTHCDEVSYTLPLSSEALPHINEVLKLLGLHAMQEPEIKNLLESNDLIESVTIDKKRDTYEDSHFHIDIDTVKNLGSYLEIEKMTDEHANYKKIQDEMKTYVKQLPLHPVDVGYNELYWRKHNFELYLKGKYLLLADRKQYRSQSL